MKHTESPRPLRAWEIGWLEMYSKGETAQPLVVEGVEVYPVSEEAPPLTPQNDPAVENLQRQVEQLRQQVAQLQGELRELREQHTHILELVTSPSVPPSTSDVSAGIPTATVESDFHASSLALRGESVTFFPPVSIAVPHDSPAPLPRSVFLWQTGDRYSLPLDVRAQNDAHRMMATTERSTSAFVSETPIDTSTPTTTDEQIVPVAGPEEFRQHPLEAPSSEPDMIERWLGRLRTALYVLLVPLAFTAWWLNFPQTRCEVLRSLGLRSQTSICAPAQ